MGHIPLLAEEGWLRHQENAAKPQRRRRRARSASAIARSRNSGQFGWPSKAELTTPSAANRNGSIFLMSRTPRLCEEGNVPFCGRSFSFIFDTSAVEAYKKAIDHQQEVVK